MKRILKLLFVSVLFIFCITGISATTYAAEVDVDDACDILTGDEYDTLFDEAQELSSKSNFNVLIVTTDSVGEKSLRDYADDYYDDYMGEIDTDGVIILLSLDEDNRGIQVETSGIAIRYLTDARLDNLLDDAVQYAKKGNYFKTLEVCVQRIDSYYEQGIPANQHTVREHWDLTPSENLMMIVLSIVVAICIVVFIRVKTANRYYDPNYTKPPLVPNSNCSNLRVKRDTFMHTHTSRIYSPRSSGSSGGGGSSSTHHSSSGGSHGGGGRSF